MKVPSSVVQVCWLILAIFTGTALSSSQTTEQHRTFDITANQNTIVRFFYQPVLSSRHPALLFRVVGDKDSRLNTMSIAEAGYTVDITLGEMTDLLQKLAHSDLLWQESDQVEVPKTFKGRVLTDGMEIKVFSRKGTAQSLTALKKICATLEPFDSVFKEPRALWEYQMFRHDDGCSVPGLNRDAYPDHWGQP
jgi:hypothetical protein